jgi:spermidine/putrescine ABC transporter ATP-binding subunit
MGSCGAAALSVAGLTRSFGKVRALCGVDLNVERGELMTILGPSGSGKTTLLKAIAGFEFIDGGVIALDGHDITALPPARREIAMVFQHYALFPHMQVADNIAFPLKMRRVPGREIAKRVHEVLKLVAMAEFSDRYPGQLSGGQQQRVALARAIVFNPKLLLLDEPFGALDRKLREFMQLEVRRLQQRLQLTTLFITHDQEEALVMSDRIAIMRDGAVSQCGSPQDIYARPHDPFVADFVGESNLIAGRIAHIVEARAFIVAAGGRQFTASIGRNFSRGDAVALLLRPETPRPVAAPARPDNEVSGHIAERIYLGNALKLRIATADGLELLVRWPMSSSQHALTMGAPITVGWDAGEAHVLRAGG